MTENKEYDIKPVESQQQGQTELDKALEQVPADQKERLETIKTSMDAFKDKIVNRLEGYVMGVSLLPPAEDDKNKEFINALVLIDDTDSTKIPKEQLAEKTQKVVDEVAATVDEKLKPQALLLSQLWQHCYDSKYDILQSIASGAIVYDTGMLAAVKISEIHKSMVLKKFEKYIVSYVLGGSLVQGTATPESDIDVFVIIDDTDVKKMSRTELRDKLRSIIVSMGMEAGQMTGIHNKINIQVYILTDFWENVKDANPVIFTFLRDGVPFYDRGTFMPWKQLLQMGRVKPSTEAIEMFKSSGKQFMDRINLKIRDIVMEDLFWAILTPSQAALMLYGIPPTTPKETPKVMREILVEKEQLIEEEFVKTLEDVLKIRKDFEHGTVKSISGTEMDDYVKRSQKYLERLDALFSEIEQVKDKENVISQFEHVLTLLRDALSTVGITDVPTEKLLESAKNHLITTGLLGEHQMTLLENVKQAKNKYDNNSITTQEVKTALKDSKEIISTLIEFVQKKKALSLDQAKVHIIYDKETYGEVLLLGDTAFIIFNANSESRTFKKADVGKGGSLDNLQDSSEDELEAFISEQSQIQKTQVQHQFFESVSSVFGNDAKILFN